jgi:hypothetical protein
MYNEKNVIRIKKAYSPYGRVFDAISAKAIINSAVGKNQINTSANQNGKG